MAIDTLLSLPMVARRLAVDASDVRRWWKSGTFIDPVELPDGRLRWRASEVAGWMAGRPARARASTARPARVHNSPAASPLEPLTVRAEEILQAIREAGEWITGPEIEAAAGGNLDSRGGTFRRAIDALKERGLVRSDPRRGYLYVGPESEAG